MQSYVCFGPSEVQNEAEKNNNVKSPELNTL